MAAGAQRSVALAAAASRRLLTGVGVIARLCRGLQRETVMLGATCLVHYSSKPLVKLQCEAAVLAQQRAVQFGLVRVACLDAKELPTGEIALPWTV